METEKLALEIGDTLQLQFLGSSTDTRHYVKVIGYMVGKSVLVSTPQIDGNVQLVREGQQVIARIMVGNDVVGFSGSVLRVCARPYPYLHLSYPHDMQAITVRKALRVALNMTAAMRPFGEDGEVNREVTPKAVTILDLSTTGALLTAAVALGEVGDTIAITLRLSVAGEMEDIMIPSIVRNVREPEPDQNSEGKLLHGVEFKLTERRESVLLHAFVYEQIAHASDD